MKLVRRDEDWMAADGEREEELKRCMEMHVNERFGKCTFVFTKLQKMVNLLRKSMKNWANTRYLVEQESIDRFSILSSTLKSYEVPEVLLFGPCSERGKEPQFSAEQKQR